VIRLVAYYRRNELKVRREKRRREGRGRGEKKKKRGKRGGGGKRTAGERTLVFFLASLSRAVCFFKR